MKATEKSLKFLGEYKKLKVPFFQRPFVWEKEEWKELIQTFSETQETPFLGSIIIKNEPDVVPQTFQIIDGQQRLTAILVLVKAIHDTLPENKRARIPERLNNFAFFSVNEADEDLFVKIEHSRSDKGDFDTIMKAGFRDGYPALDVNAISENDSRIKRCYKFFVEYLNAIEDDNKVALFNNVFNDNNKAIVLITLEMTDKNEQSIFDSINRAGVHLTNADIIKNSIFQSLLRLCQNDENAKRNVFNLYDNGWQGVFLPTNIAEAEKWQQERSFGNIKRTNLEFLLYCVMLIKSATFFKDKELVSAYKQFLDAKSKDEIMDLVQDICNYGKIFKKYIIDFKGELEDSDTDVQFKNSDDLKKFLLLLDKFGVQMFYPYVLMKLKSEAPNLATNQWAISDATKQDFKLLETYLVRNRLAGSSVSDYIQKCHKLIHIGMTDIIAELVSTTGALSDIRLNINIGNVSSNETAKLLLFFIELSRITDADDIQSLDYKFSLEHIMPQKWEEFWTVVPIKDDQGNVIADPQGAKTHRFRHIYSLGNMTLLRKALNSSLKNKGFSDKIGTDTQRNHCYVKSASIKITKDIISAFRDGATTWDESQISSRATRLFNEIKSIWAIPEVQ